MEGKIIAVWGSPHSGKTTFATKLATAIYSSFESTVITLYTDLETPVIPILFPFDKNEDLGSVGYPLSKTEVEQGDIINNLVNGTSTQNFGRYYVYNSSGELKVHQAQPSQTALASYYSVADYDSSVTVVDVAGLLAYFSYADLTHMRLGGVLTGAASDVIITADENIV